MTLGFERFARYAVSLAGAAALTLILIVNSGSVGPAALTGLA